ncbi:phage holin family protein [Opitutus sp. ER46]|uniref:phage holin family protein n=1 Tax=Opitutus sp. ER46 TaxID=2161864 RepID=UPI001304FBD8|nr:phage holin family protein [Opitutus sp. ER46]
MPHPNSLPALLRELRDDTTTLLRQEVALAKAELKQNASSVGQHTVQMAIGGFVAYAGLIVLLIGLGLLGSSLLVRAGLDPDLAEWLAPAAIGAAVALIGWSLVARARRALAADQIAPRETLQSLREDKDWAQSKLPHSA